jgi:hypothetical protein
MTDGVQQRGIEGVKVRDELQKARDELRPKLHLAGADTLSALEMIEREIEHLSSSAIDEASLQAAVAQIRHVSATLDRVRVGHRQTSHPSAATSRSADARDTTILTAAPTSRLSVLDDRLRQASQLAAEPVAGDDQPTEGCDRAAGE